MTATGDFFTSFQARLDTIKSIAKNKKSFENDTLQTLELISIDESKKKIVFRLPNVSSGYENNIGTIHGGALATWVDVVTSIASHGFNSWGGKLVSVSLSVDYLSSASSGCNLYLVATVDKIGKTLTFSSCQITTNDGKLIAQARHTMANVANERPRAKL